MGNKRRLFTETSHFVWGEALIMLSGLISFPILTRVLSVEQYGIFSLIGITIGILMAISSLGSIRSIVRLYEKYKKLNLLPTLLSTLFTATIASGLFFLFSTLLVSKFFLKGWGVVQHAYLSFALALLWMVFQNLFTLLNTVYRMEGKAVLYNVSGIIRKYGSLAVSVILVLVFHSLTSFYAGMLVTEGVFVILLTVFMIKTFHASSGNQKPFSKEILSDSLSYGFPLALSTIPFLILNSGDRYIIEAFLGTEEVAVYSVGYNLCMYIKELIISPLNLALIPILFKLWESGKTDDIKEMLSFVIRYFMMFAIPICFLTFIISHDLITLLASDKYARSAAIMPIVLIGVFLQALDFPLSAGLHFAKKTNIFLIIMIGTSAVNIGLNFIIIPKYGIMGAATTTLVSYIIYTLVFYLISRKYFRVSIQYVKIMQYFILSFICFISLSWFSSVMETGSKFINIVIISVSFFTLYSVMLFFTDKDIKAPMQKVMGYLQKG